MLKIRNVSVTFADTEGDYTAVDNVSLDLEQGKILGILGESGSGKSQLLRAVTRLTSGRIEGAAILNGVDLLAIPKRELHKVRGRQISYIFQNPMTALNPYLRVQTQITEGARRHLSLTRNEATLRAGSLLAQVGIKDPERVLSAYPHELSGGMRQRVVIAMALISEPALIVADEPTTALDSTVQLQILHLLKLLGAEKNIGIVLISHDLGVVSSICDETLVMYAGRVVERGPTAQLIHAPKHPYSKSLLRATPRIDLDEGDVLEDIPGELPARTTPRQQCLFSPRCKYAQSICREQTPELGDITSNVACHFPLDVVV